jgi:hypothetical protein
MGRILKVDHTRYKWKDTEVWITLKTSLILEATVIQTKLKQGEEED